MAPRERQKIINRIWLAIFGGITVLGVVLLYKIVHAFIVAVLLGN